MLGPERCITQPIPRLSYHLPNPQMACMGMVCLAFMHIARKGMLSICSKSFIHCCQPVVFWGRLGHCLSFWSWRPVSGLEASKNTDTSTRLELLHNASNLPSSFTCQYQRGSGQCATYSHPLQITSSLIQLTARWHACWEWPCLLSCTAQAVHQAQSLRPMLASLSKPCAAMLGKGVTQ